MQLMLTKPRGHGHCPTPLWRRFLAIQEGAYDYARFGRAVLLRLESLQTWETSDTVWRSRVEALRLSLESRDDAMVLRWFQDVAPRVLALVPRQRDRREFLRGLYRTVREEGEEVFLF